jgi:hypothetical protein
VDEKFGPGTWDEIKATSERATENAQKGQPSHLFGYVARLLLDGGEE